MIFITDSLESLHAYHFDTECRPASEGSESRRRLYDADENSEAQGAEDASQPKSGDETQPDPAKQEAANAADGSVIDEKQQDISRTDATGSEDSKNIRLVLR